MRRAGLLIFLFATGLVRAQTDSLVVGIQDIAWSPDSRFLYFSAMRHKPDWSDFAPGKWSVYRYGMRDNITTLVMDSAYTVAVSPNGERIAVGRLVGKEHHIHVADADGTNARELTTGSVDDIAPSWSPDGRSLIFNRRFEHGPEVCMIQTDGEGFQQLTFSGADKAYNPVFSPDGRFIVYYLEKGDHRDQIHVMRANGTDDRNVTNDTMNNFHPAWLDSRTVTYTQDQKNGMMLAFRVDTEGREKKPLSGVRSFFTRVSPDRSMIAFVDQEEGGILVITRISGSRVAFIQP